LNIKLHNLRNEIKFRDRRTLNCLLKQKVPNSHIFLESGDKELSNGTFIRPEVTFLTSRSKVKEPKVAFRIKKVRSNHKYLEPGQ